MLVDDEKAFERLAICNGCPKLLKENWVCSECGCYMKIKARLDWAECPLKKW